MLTSNWRLVTKAARRMKFARVARPSGWNPKRSPKRVTGYHKCLPKAEMALILADWE